MPSFILQEFKRELGKPKQTTIFTKNEYSDGVKMPEWERIKECEPKDNNPYDPPGGDQFLSTYNRIGFLDEVDHFLTTSRMIYKPFKPQDKHLLEDDGIRYLPLRDTTSIKPLHCAIGQECSPDYMTTMQDSYRMPCPGVIKALSIPKIPFLQNRKLIWEEPNIDANKFYDDCATQKIKNLYEIKKCRYISYDPMRNVYSDGTPLKSNKKKCHEVPFQHVK